MSHTTSSIVAVAVALVAGVGVANAQGLGTSRGYVKIFGGVTIPQDDSFDLEFPNDESISSGLDYDAGTVAGLAAGYFVKPDVALEFEFSFRIADNNLETSTGVTGQMKSNTYMANAIYTFEPIDAAGAWRPYAGIGLGATDLTYEPNGAGRLGGDLTFAYQALAGIGYRVNESWTLSGEVRYLGVSEQDVTSDFASFETSYQTFDALVGATYRF